MANNWGKRPSAERPPKTLTEFVTGYGPSSRLALNIPKDLHTRVKVAYAAQQRSMREVLIELLERHFPPDGIKEASARSSES